jgi:hypothetical protein
VFGSIGSRLPQVTPVFLKSAALERRFAETGALRGEREGLMAPMADALTYDVATGYSV